MVILKSVPCRSRFFFFFGRPPLRLCWRCHFIRPHCTSTADDRFPCAPQSIYKFTPRFCLFTFRLLPLLFSSQHSPDMCPCICFSAVAVANSGHLPDSAEPSQPLTAPYITTCQPASPRSLPPKSTSAINTGGDGIPWLPSSPPLSRLIEPDLFSQPFSSRLVQSSLSIFTQPVSTTRGATLAK